MTYSTVSFKASPTLKALVRLCFSLVVPLWLSGCVIDINQLTEDEISDAVNLRGVGYNRYITLRYETSPNTRYALYRSDSLSSLAELRANAVTSAAFPPQPKAGSRVQMLNDSVSGENLFVDGCPISKTTYNKAPYPQPNPGIVPPSGSIPGATYDLKDEGCHLDSQKLKLMQGVLYNDITYYYMLAIQEPTKNLFLAYSNIVPVTPRPIHPPEDAILNGGIGDRNKLVAPDTASNAGLLLSNFQLTVPVIEKNNGFVEYNLYLSPLPRMNITNVGLGGKLCDYVNQAFCEAPDYTGAATELDRAIIEDISTQALTQKPQNMHQLLYSNPVIQANNQKQYGTPVSTDATPNVTLPLFVTLEGVNSYGSSSYGADKGQELAIQRIENLAFNTALKGVDLAFLPQAGYTTPESPLLKTWGADFKPLGDILPVKYEASIVENTAAPDDIAQLWSGSALETRVSNTKFFTSGQPWHIKNLKAGHDYWIQLSAEYRLTNPLGGVSYTASPIYRVSKIALIRPLEPFLPPHVMADFVDWKEQSLQNKPDVNVVVLPSYDFEAFKDNSLNYYVNQKRHLDCPTVLAACSSFAAFSTAATFDLKPFQRAGLATDATSLSYDAKKTSYPGFLAKPGQQIFELYQAKINGKISAFDSQDATLTRFTVPTIQASPTADVTIRFKDPFVSSSASMLTAPTRYYLLIRGPYTSLAGTDVATIYDPTTSLDGNLAAVISATSPEFVFSKGVYPSSVVPGLIPTPAPNLNMQSDALYFFKVVAANDLNKDSQDDYLVSKVYRFVTAKKPEAPILDAFFSDPNEATSPARNYYVLTNKPKPSGSDYVLMFSDFKPLSDKVSPGTCQPDYFGMSKPANAQVLEAESESQINKHCLFGTVPAARGVNFDFTQPMAYNQAGDFLSSVGHTKYFYIINRPLLGGVHSEPAKLGYIPVTTQARFTKVVAQNGVAITWKLPVLNPTMPSTVEPVLQGYDLHFAENLSDLDKPTQVIARGLSPATLNYLVPAAQLKEGVVYHIKVVAKYKTQTTPTKEVYRISKVHSVYYRKPPHFVINPTLSGISRGLQIYESYLKPGDFYQKPTYARNASWYTPYGKDALDLRKNLYQATWQTGVSGGSNTDYKIFFSDSAIQAGQDKPDGTFLEMKLSPTTSPTQQFDFSIPGTQYSRQFFGTLQGSITIAGSVYLFTSDSTVAYAPPEEPMLLNASSTLAVSQQVFHLEPKLNQQGKIYFDFDRMPPSAEAIKAPFDTLYHYGLMIQAVPWFTTGATCTIFDLHFSQGCYPARVGKSPPLEFFDFGTVAASAPHPTPTPLGLSVRNGPSKLRIEPDTTVFDSYVILTPISYMQAADSIPILNARQATQGVVPLITQVTVADPSWDPSKPPGKHNKPPGVIGKISIPDFNPGDKGGKVDVPDPLICKPIYIKWAFFDKDMDPLCDYPAIAKRAEANGNIVQTADFACTDRGSLSFPAKTTMPLDIRYPPGVLSPPNVPPDPKESLMFLVTADGCDDQTGVVNPPIKVVPRVSPAPRIIGANTASGQELQTIPGTAPTPYSSYGTPYTVLYRFPVKTGGASSYIPPRNLFLRVQNGLGLAQDGICNYLSSQTNTAAGTSFYQTANNIDPDCNGVSTMVFADTLGIDSLFDDNPKTYYDTFSATADYIAVQFNKDNSNPTGQSSTSTSPGTVTGAWSNIVRLGPYTGPVYPLIEFCLDRWVPGGTYHCPNWPPTFPKPPVSTYMPSPTYTVSSSPNIGLDKAPLSLFDYKWVLLDASSTKCNPITSYKASPDFQVDFANCPIVSNPTIDTVLNGGVRPLGTIKTFEATYILPPSKLPKAVLKTAANQAQEFYMTLEAIRKSDKKHFYLEPQKGYIGSEYVEDSLVMGRDHACVIESAYERRVFCWGRNTSGQLGSGNTLDKLRDAYPVLLASGKPLRGVIRISAGEGFSCAISAWDANNRLSNRRQVYCWGKSEAVGYNSTTPKIVTYAQLVDDAFIPDNSNPSGTYNAAEISSGYISTCAIFDSVSGGAGVGQHDRIRCWGGDQAAEVSVDPNNYTDPNTCEQPPAGSANPQSRACGVDKLVGIDSAGKMLKGYNPIDISMSVLKASPEVCSTIEAVDAAGHPTKTLRCWGVGSSRILLSPQAGGDRVGTQEVYEFLGLRGTLYNEPLPVNPSSPSNKPAGNFNAPFKVSIGDEFLCVATGGETPLDTWRFQAYPPTAASVSPPTLTQDSTFPGGETIRCIGRGGKNGAFRLGFNPFDVNKNPFFECGANTPRQNSAKVFRATDTCSISLWPTLLNKGLIIDGMYKDYDRAPSYYNGSIYPKHGFLTEWALKPSGFQFSIPKDSQIKDLDSGNNHSCLRYEGNFQNGVPQIRSAACWGQTRSVALGTFNYNFISPAFEDSAIAPFILNQTPKPNKQNPAKFGEYLPGWLSEDGFATIFGSNGGASSDARRSVFAPYILRDDKLVSSAPVFSNKQFVDVIAVATGAQGTCLASYDGTLRCLGDLSFSSAAPPGNWLDNTWNTITLHP